MTSLFFLSLSFSPLLALEVPKRPQGYVSDYAGLLSSGARLQLEEKLRQFEEETTNQVVVAIFPSLEGESLEDFSIRLAEAWKVGQKGKDNGVILVIFKADRAVRIEVGYGLEGALPDATSKLIIENEIVPQFREGKFDEGVIAAVEAIVAATKGEYQAPPRPATEKGAGSAGAFLFGFFLGALLPFLLLRLLFIFSTVLIFGSVAAAAYGAALNWALIGVLPLALYYLLGRSGRTYTTFSRRGAYWSGGSWGGGGFGGGWGGGFGGGFGGGGGSFGGGGASGRW